MRRRERIIYNPDLDYYQLIGVPADASPDELQRAYRRRAKAIHPDINPERREWATTAFKQLVEAYRVLSDPDLRAWYDDLRRSHFSFGPAGVRSHNRARRATRYRMSEMPRFSDAWFRHQLASIWRWRVFLFWSVMGIVGLIMLLGWAFTPPPLPLPSIEEFGTVSGCDDPGLYIASLTLEIDADANVPRTLRAKGSAVVDFTLALYQAEQLTPLSASRPAKPVYDAELGYFDIPTQRDVVYMLLLQDMTGTRPACQVSFLVT